MNKFGRSGRFDLIKESKVSEESIGAILSCQRGGLLDLFALRALPKRIQARMQEEHIVCLLQSRSLQQPVINR